MRTAISKQTTVASTLVLAIRVACLCVRAFSLVFQSCPSVVMWNVVGRFLIGAGFEFRYKNLGEKVFLVEIKEIFCTLFSVLCCGFS